MIKIQKPTIISGDNRGTERMIQKLEEKMDRKFEKIYTLLQTALASQPTKQSSPTPKQPQNQSYVDTVIENDRIDMIAGSFDRLQQNLSTNLERIKNMEESVDHDKKLADLCEEEDLATQKQVEANRLREAFKKTREAKQSYLREIEQALMEEEQIKEMENKLIQNKREYQEKTELEKKLNLDDLRTLRISDKMIIENKNKFEQDYSASQETINEISWIDSFSASQSFR